MAYHEFAYFYDEFNGEADYDALYAQIKGQLDAHGIQNGIVARSGLWDRRTDPDADAGRL